MNKRIERAARKGLLVLAAGVCLGAVAACSKDQDFYTPETISATDGGANAAQPDLKDDPELVDLIANSKGDGKYQAEESWQEQFTSGKVTVNIDAAVSVPDVDKYPVIKVSDSKITQEAADKAFQYLSQGKELLGESGLEATDVTEPADGEAPADGETPEETPVSISEATAPVENEEIEITAESLQEQIDQLAVVKAELEKGNTEIDGVSYSQTPEDIQAMIDALEDSKAQLGQEGEAGGGQPASGPVTKFNDASSAGTTGQQLVAFVDLGRQTRDRILIQNYEENFFQHSEIRFESADPARSSMLDDSYLPANAEETQPGGVEMSREDAEAKAKEAAQALGLELEVASVRRGYGYAWEDAQAEGWVVRMRRSASGVQAVATSETSVMINVNSTNAATYGLEQLFEASDVSPDVAPMEAVQVNGYDYEELIVCLDDSGITFLNWKGSVALGDVENDNVKLLAFEELKQAITSSGTSMSVYQQLDLDSDDTIDKVDVNIDDMRLGLMRIPLEGDPKGGRLIPVWTLSGSYTPAYNKEKTLAMLGSQQGEGSETPEQIWEQHFSPEVIAQSRRSYGVQMVVNALNGKAIPPVL